MNSRKLNQTNFWQDHLTKHKGSGLFQAAYCRDLGIKAHRLKYYLGYQAEAPRVKKTTVGRLDTTVSEALDRFAPSSGNGYVNR